MAKLNIDALKSYFVHSFDLIGLPLRLFRFGIEKLFVNLRRLFTDL